MNNYNRSQISAAIIFTLIVLLNCSGCPNGESGKLMPQKAENVRLVKTEKADDTAQIEKDGKIFLISGSWRSNGGQDLRIVITNNTDTEFQFDVQKVKVESISKEALLFDEAVEDTNVNSADENPNNDDPKIVYSANKSYDSGKLGNANESKKSSSSSILIVPANKSRTIAAYFGNFQKEENRLHSGSQIYVTVPTGEYPADSIKILFNCADSQFFGI